MHISKNRQEQNGPNTMPMAQALDRRCFDDAIPADPRLRQWGAMLKQVLLTQDGSTTLICETIANGPVRLDVLYQQVTHDPPEEIRLHLAGTQFIERQVCLSHHGKVMMDNLTYVSLEQLDSDVLQHLMQEKAPIGHIFDVKQTRKRPVACPEAVLAILWTRCGVPDPQSARSYILEIENKSCMLITETYRAGIMYDLYPE